VLRVGGPAQEGIARLRGGAGQTGFGTGGTGDLGLNENKFIADALRSSVGSFIGQAAPGLVEGARRSAQGAFEISESGIRDMINNLFTGEAGAQSRGLAEPTRGFLGGLFDRIL
jgi:hypothetical protein